MTWPMSTSLKVVEHGGGVLRILEPARDGLAQPRHAHALLARGIVGRRRRADLNGGGRRGDRRRLRRGALDRRQHVALGDAAVLAGAGHGRRIHAGFGGELAHRRRQRHVGGRRRREQLARLRFAAARPAAPAVRPAFAAGLCGSARRRTGALLDLAEQRADGDRFAVLDRNLGEHAGGRRRHLDRHLVGLKLDQRLVDRDRVARLLEPFADRRFGHRLAERGHANLSHGIPFVMAGLVPAIHDCRRHAVKTWRPGAGRA